jgi:hypothetical protein
MHANILLLDRKKLGYTSTEAVCMRKVALSLLLDGVIAGVATALSGALILPTLAGDKLRDSLADALQGLGHSISG